MNFVIKKQEFNNFNVTITVNNYDSILGRFKLIVETDKTYTVLFSMKGIELKKRLLGLNKFFFNVHGNCSGVFNTRELTSGEFERITEDLEYIVKYFIQHYKEDIEFAHRVHNVEARRSAICHSLENKMIRLAERVGKGHIDDALLSHLAEVEFELRKTKERFGKSSEDVARLDGDYLV